MADLNVDIVSPDGSVFRGQASGVRAPGVEGSFEVRYNHAPMIAAFEVGSLMLTTTTGDRLAFATSGGFLEVLNNTVTVLAETAEPASDIDVERAKASEQRALDVMQSSAAGSEERRRAERMLERARNRLRVSMGRVGN
ncbi:MAG: ATP synthase F1 subunit epsilon [Bacteroidota bacterium]